MNLAFLLPAAFAALAALLIPLLIHLARRSEQRPTNFAALRWLRAMPRPRHRIRVDEWPLLLLRLLLLVALAVLLARPVLPGSASHAPWIAVVPGVDLEAVRKATVLPDARRHWLAPGFPKLDMSTADETAPAGPLAIISLLRELDASLPVDVPLTVFVPAQLSGVDAQRPVLGRHVDWRVVPGEMSTSTATRLGPAPALTVRHASDRASAVRYLRAASAAWEVSASSDATSGSRFSAAPAAQPLDARVKNLVWLAPGPLPASVHDWITNGGLALLDAGTEFERPAHVSAFWRDDIGVPLVEGGTLGRGRVLRLTRPFSPQAMPQLLEPDFPRHLRALFEAPTPAPTRVHAADHAPLPGGQAFAQPPRDLQPWLLWCIAFLFGLERWLATSPRRGVAP